MIKEYPKKAIINVNSSLSMYDKDYVFLKRYILGEKEKIESFSQFIECRLNFELSLISEIFPYVETFDGFLFKVKNIEGCDDSKRRFKNVTAEITNDFIQNEDAMKVINELISNLGWKTISFGYSQKKVKIILN